MIYDASTAMPFGARRLIMSMFLHIYFEPASWVPVAISYGKIGTYHEEQAVLFRYEFTYCCTTGLLELLVCILQVCTERTDDPTVNTHSMWIPKECAAVQCRNTNSMQEHKLTEAQIKVNTPHVLIDRKFVYLLGIRVCQQQRSFYCHHWTKHLGKTPSVDTLLVLLWSITRVKWCIKPYESLTFQQLLTLTHC